MPSGNNGAFLDMELDDIPLLNEPNVMLVALKVAADGPASRRRCLDRLDDCLRLAGHSLPTDREPVRRRIDAAYRCLRIARLVERDEDGRFLITDRGASTLKAHPLGIDTSVLVTFPEFRAFIRRRSKERSRNAVREPARSYDQGYMAGLVGDPITDNPYSAESFAHLEWENGWCEGFEQKLHYIPSIGSEDDAGAAPPEDDDSDR